MQTPPQPLMVIRNITDPALANVIVPLSKPGLLHRVRRSGRRRYAAGDHGAAARSAASSSGRILSRCRCSESIHGVAVRPNSDDVTAEIASDKIILGRPGGLTLSSADIAAERAPTAVRPIFDVGEWQQKSDRKISSRGRMRLSPPRRQPSPISATPARVNLARFYMSRGMYPEAKGVLDLALANPSRALRIRLF